MKWAEMYVRLFIYLVILLISKTQMGITLIYKYNHYLVN